MQRPFLAALALPRVVRSPRTALVAVAALVAALGLIVLPPTGRAAPASGLAEGAQSQVQPQVLTWTAGDSFTEYLSFPPTAHAGPTTIVFENSAATGNNSGMQHTLTFDVSTPGYNHDLDINIFADPYDSKGGRHQIDVVLKPGKYRYFCAIPGHGAMSGELIVTADDADTTPPTVTAAVTGERDGDGAYVGAATVTLAAIDTESGVERVEYSLNGGVYGTYFGPVTVNQPGDHTLSYRATDKAGNTSSPQSVSFRVVAPTPKDTTPPTVTAAVTGERDGAGAYVGSATVTLTAIDTESGVDRVEYSLNGGAYGTYSGPVTVNQPGDHTLSYRATDKAGNISSPQSVSFTVVAPPAKDTTPPTVTASVAGERDGTGAYVGSATVTLAAIDTESGVERVEFSLNGAPYAVYSAPVTVNQPGDHTVTYRATDKAGNTSSPQSVSFTVVAPPAKDTTPPTVMASLSGQQDDLGNYIGSVTVTLTATDDESGVERVEYSLNASAYTAYSMPVTVNLPGQHILSYRATDKAGNTSGTGSVTFSVAASGSEPTCAPDTRPTVWLGNVDSGVPNRVVEETCTINNLIDDERDWTSHGQFVKHVGELIADLRAARIIDQKEAAAIQNAAARSGVGKPEEKNG
ncbi:MAG TPA: copper-binding protein [Micromonosporaceae bacterium]|nr:copper-binding protein [Micromonosporaceae bacterium]